MYVPPPPPQTSNSGYAPVQGGNISNLVVFHEALFGNNETNNSIKNKIDKYTSISAGKIQINWYPHEITDHSRIILDHLQEIGEWNFQINFFCKTFI